MPWQGSIAKHAPQAASSLRLMKSEALGASRCVGFGVGTSNRMYVMNFIESSLPPVSPRDAAPLVARVAGSVL